MQVHPLDQKLDTSLYALKKSMQVQEQLVEKVIDDAMKQQQSSPINKRLGRYLDVRG